MPPKQAASTGPGRGGAVPKRVGNPVAASGRKTLSTAPGVAGVAGVAGGRGRGRGGGRGPAGPQGVRKVGAQGVKAKTQSTKGVNTKDETKTPKKPSWTKEDKAARKIQTCFRAYRCRKLLLQLKQKKREYEELMDKLQREAYVAMVKMEQEKTEREREREEEGRRRRRELAKRVRRMLEAAFDGDTQEILTLLNEVATSNASLEPAMVQRLKHRLVESRDPNENTPLSEASAGGQPETIRLLVSLGADPNTKGQFGRTPLYRAAFAGSLEAVQVLLEYGADPSVYADDGATPQQVAAQPVVEECLKGWDRSETERVMVEMGRERERRKEEEQRLWACEEDKLQKEIEEVEKENSAKQKELLKAHEELNKRIYEHDKPSNHRPDLTIKAVHDAEEVLEIAKLHSDEARQRLQQASLKLRAKRSQFQDLDQEGGQEDPRADVVIALRELDDVLMKDVGNKIADSGKWPLIIDTSRQAKVFLQYRDTNFLNSCNPNHMAPETIRLAVLGAVRYGKFVVIDLMDVEDMWSAVETKFKGVQTGLLDSIVTKGLLKDEKYLSLVRPSDGEEYSRNQLLSARTHEFGLVVLTGLANPNPGLLEMFYVIRVQPTDPGTSF